MVEFSTIILAGGLGKRMRSNLPKVLHPICGRPMIDYPLELANVLGSRQILVVTPGKKNGINVYLKQYSKVCQVGQKSPLGTADAVLSCQRWIHGSEETLLILSGDTPLLQAGTIQTFLKRFEALQATVGFISTQIGNPTGYGRVMRDADGDIQGIVEEAEATEQIKGIREINAGIYVVKKKWLFSVLKGLEPHRMTGEYYLTDIIGKAVEEREPLLGFLHEAPMEFLGVNSRKQLAFAEAEMRHRWIDHWMARGVTFLDPQQVYLDAETTIGQDSVIYPQVYLRGKTTIGRNCVVANGVVLRDAILGDSVHVKPYSIVEESRIDNEAEIGPFARLRPGTEIGKKARVGNFVELKKTKLGAGAKANHLAYLGDADIGAETNIGCGTITCNYDGEKKHPTKIGKNVFVGSDVQFVAPVTVGSGAYIAAGSTITKDVPSGSLGIARERQINKTGWVKKKKR